MRSRLELVGIVGALALTLIAGCHRGPRDLSPTGSRAVARSKVAFTRALPPLKGDSLRAFVVEVIYAPGESSEPHSHPCPVVGYVIEGRLVTQVEGERAAIYGRGETFYEAPAGVHLVSANASMTETVRFLAYFVCDHDAPLSTRHDSGE